MARILIVSEAGGLWIVQHKYALVKSTVEEPLLPPDESRGVAYIGIRITALKP
ncbi:MAG TPA: hypothetical protein VFY05_00870 [Candidatus Angelobacter sp.]|nr:hypothetical protein [Candidatus Angelobacter sp.]